MHGSAPDIEAYPFQTLDVPMDNDYGIDWPWLNSARLAAQLAEIESPDWRARGAGEFKWPGRTPLDTLVVELVRFESTGRMSREGWEQDADHWHEGDAEPAPVGASLGTGNKERHVRLPNDGIDSMTLEEYRARQ
jgi:hypothetical protein